MGLWGQIIVIHYAAFNYSRKEHNLYRMSLCAEAAALLAAITAEGAKSLQEQTPAEVRASDQPLASLEVVHEIRNVDADGVPCRLYRPSLDKEDCSPGDSTQPHQLGLLIFIHGGGFVLGSLDKSDNVCRLMCNQSGHAVLSVGYRLAPEYAFPIPIEDCITAARWAHTHCEDDLGCDSARMCVAGDSAGGTLATLVAQRSFVPFLAQVLIYPVIDCRPLYDGIGLLEASASASGIAHSYVTFGKGGFGLTYADMKWFYDHYITGSEDKVKNGDTETLCLLNPCLASAEILCGMPPTLIITAECDVLRDEGEAYASLLQHLHVQTKLVRYKGHMHGFFGKTSTLSDAKDAVWRVSCVLRRAMHKDSENLDSLFITSAQKDKRNHTSGTKSKYVAGTELERGRKDFTRVLPKRSPRKTSKAGGVSAASPLPHYALPLNRAFSPGRGRSAADMSSEWDEDNDEVDDEGADLDFVRFLIARSALIPPGSMDTPTSHQAQASEEEPMNRDREFLRQSNKLELYQQELKEAAVADRFVRRQLAKQFDNQYRKWLQGLSQCDRSFVSSRGAAAATVAGVRSVVDSTMPPPPGADTDASFQSIDSGNQKLRYSLNLRSRSPSPPRAPRPSTAEEAALFITPKWNRDRVATDQALSLGTWQTEDRDIDQSVSFVADTTATLTPLQQRSPVHSRFANEPAAEIMSSLQAAQRRREQDKEAKRQKEVEYRQWLKTTEESVSKDSSKRIVGDAQWGKEINRLQWLVRQKKAKDTYEQRFKAMRKQVLNVAYAGLAKDMRLKLPRRVAVEPVQSKRV